ncbi:MAG: flagellar biosynthesis protein FlhB [Planctomycetes bacterium]|nr:flagellar biosynthesis protein FlhB [Planctomycetota bacterium]
MALFRDDSGKTEKPTAERLQKARNRGQTGISREFTMAASLIVAVLAIEWFGGSLIDALEKTMRQGLNVDFRSHFRNSDGSIDPLREIHLLVSTVAPPFILLVSIFVAATALAGYSQIGFRFAREALGIKFTKLNPVANIGQIFQPNSLVKALFSLVKLAALGGVLYFVLQTEWETLAAMHQNESFPANVAYVAHLALRVFFWVALIVLLMAIGDVFWNRYRHTKSLMMSKQEVDDERKRNEGDPMIKSRLKSARLALMKQRMMEAVPKADVVITNPTHVSVALHYERTKHAAPRVVAKGQNELALRIRQLAREHGVPLMEDPPLARALFRAVDVGREIPERFFKAVAAVLGHVYRMKGEVA